ncbi:MAG: hypothetical protein JKX76_01070 [Colwellia sp.]|nr:hypothetical protein [Colwellia sp.]
MPIQEYETSNTSSAEIARQLKTDGVLVLNNFIQDEEIIQNAATQDVPGGRTECSQTEQIWHVRLALYHQLMEIGRAFFGEDKHLTISADTILKKTIKNSAIHFDTYIPSLQCFFALEDTGGASTACVPESSLGTPEETENSLLIDFSQERVEVPLLGITSRPKGDIWCTAGSDEDESMLDEKMIHIPLARGSIQIMRNGIWHRRDKLSGTKGTRQNLAISISCHSQSQISLTQLSMDFRFSKNGFLTTISQGLACFMKGCPTGHLGVIHSIHTRYFKKTIGYENSWYENINCIGEELTVNKLAIIIQQEINETIPSLLADDQITEFSSVDEIKFELIQHISSVYNIPAEVVDFFFGVN